MSIYLTRQPIFCRDESVFAYELLYRCNDENAEQFYYPENSDSGSSSAVYKNSLFGVDTLVYTGGSKAYINFTGGLINRQAVREFSPDLVVCEVGEEQLDDELVQSEIAFLKEQGYTIALTGTEHSEKLNEYLPNCDIVRLDIKLPQKELEEKAYVCRYSNKLILADNVETAAELDYAKKLGCAYMRGGFFALPSQSAENNLQPLPVNLVGTMQLMASPEPEISDIVNVMSRDTAMCQRILRLINSVYYGVSSKVSSINQAILILGLDYLREWVYLMGMQKISQNENMELMKLALLLAKFSRGLSGLIPMTGNQGESFYLMGLLSMMVFSGERFLAQALEEFPLTNDIKKGLLRRGGIYSDVFEMAMSYSEGKWDEFDAIAVKYHLNPDEVSELFTKCITGIDNLSN